MIARDCTEQLSAVALSVNRNWKKLTDSRKRAKILADNRECHHPSETLKQSQRMVGESI